MYSSFFVAETKMVMVSVFRNYGLKIYISSRFVILSSRTAVNSNINVKIYVSDTVCAKTALLIWKHTSTVWTLWNYFPVEELFSLSAQNQLNHKLVHVDHI